MSGSSSPPVSCLVFTLNEEINLPHCLRSLQWCDDIVVVDSYSSDGTEQIARQFTTRFVTHGFTGFGDQRNWALDNVTLQHPWALVLDADEQVPPEMVGEMRHRLQNAPDDLAAFRVRRRFHLWGKWLRYSSLYPTWVVRLVRVGRVRFVNRGHAETQHADGRIESLQSDLLDQNHKGLDDWWHRQINYARRDADYELTQPRASFRELLTLDPLRRRAALKSLSRSVPGRPLWYFLYSYVLRGGMLDGMDGFRFCCMKAMYQALVGLYKRELRQQESSSSGSPRD